ncbi:MAG: PAS domain-containing protein, partial [Ilumatobacteraceae bacterium]
MEAAWVLVGLVAGGIISGLFVARVGASRFAAGPAPADAAAARALEELRATCDRLQAALDAMSVGVIVADSDGRVLVRNSAADAARGDTHNEVLVQAAVQHHLRAALRGGQRSQTVELYGPPRRVVVVHAQPLGTEGAVATIEDVTERSRLDAVRTDFVANISHELKTP